MTRPQAAVRRGHRAGRLSAVIRPASLAALCAIAATSGLGAGIWAAIT